ncbi:MAG: hypothetical protein ABIK92_16740 [Pseudomonadota bacterium]
MNAKVRGITGDVLANQEVQAVLKQDHALLEALKQTVEDGLVEKREVDDLAKLLDKSGIQGELSKEVSEVDMSGMVDQALDKVKFTEGVGNVQKMLRIAMAAVLLMLPVSAFAGENPKNVNKPRAKVEKLEQGLSLKRYIKGGKDLIIKKFGGVSPSEIQEALESLRTGKRALNQFLEVVDGRGIAFSTANGRFEFIPFEDGWESKFIEELRYWLRRHKGNDSEYLIGTLAPKGKVEIEVVGNEAPRIRLDKNPKTEADFLALHNQMKGILDKMLKGVDVNKIKNESAYVDFNDYMHDLLSQRIQDYLRDKRDPNRLKSAEIHYNNVIKRMYTLVNNLS